MSSDSSDKTSLAAGRTGHNSYCKGCGEVLFIPPLSGNQRARCPKCHRTNRSDPKSAMAYNTFAFWMAILALGVAVLAMTEPMFKLSLNGLIFTLDKPASFVEVVRMLFEHKEYLLMATLAFASGIVPLFKLYIIICLTTYVVPFPWVERIISDWASVLTKVIYLEVIVLGLTMFTFFVRTEIRIESDFGLYFFYLYATASFLAGSAVSRTTIKRRRKNNV